MSDSLVHAVSGAVGGVASMAITYPLIVLSTRAQVDASKEKRNAFEALKSVLRQDGPAGLYAGLASALFGIGVTNGVYYFWYEWTKASFMSAKRGTSQGAGMSTFESLLAGLIAGSATVIITNPVWVVNTRYITKSQPQSHGQDLTQAAAEPCGLVDAIQRIVKDEGIAGLWAGTAPALALTVNPMIGYAIFEKLKKRIEKVRALTPLDVFILGALGKLVATAITYPYITIKSRMQSGKLAARNNNTLFSVFRRAVQKNGIRGLYQGIGVKLFQSVLTAAFLFLLKDQFYNFSSKLLITTQKRAIARK